MLNTRGQKYVCLCTLSDILTKGNIKENVTTENPCGFEMNVSQLVYALIPEVLLLTRKTNSVVWKKFPSLGN